ncbi:MAG: NrfD/PsrC family molybdoenzyme membrane anchor subunit [Deltaproteobacteria bacterium]|nr:NrfD/PsrC family molybdoenzyme membrane anchor subunit [Deltaproteobacteria bacterium]
MDYTLVNEHIRWGLVVVSYMFLSGVGTGSLIISVAARLPWLYDHPALLSVRRAAIITSAACFVVIPLAILADLGQPWRMWRVVLAPHFTSAMPYGSYILMILTGLIFLNLFLIYRPGFAAAADRDDLLGKLYRLLALGYSEGEESRRERLLNQCIAVVSVVAGIAFVAYTGFLLGTMMSFGLWYTPMMAVFFALAALASGFCWMLVYASLSRGLKGDVKALRLLAGGAIVFLANLLAARLYDIFSQFYVENRISAAVWELIFDHYWFSHIGLELLGGLAAIAVMALVCWRPNRGLALAGGTLGLTSLLASRWNIIIGGQSISRTGQGFVFDELLILGREGIVAASGVILWALVLGFALWLFLPRRSGPGMSWSGPPRLRSAEGRREALFLVAGAATAFAAGYATLQTLLFPRYRKQTPGPTPPRADRVVHSICLSCDARCGNRAVIRDGVVRNLFGNPYHPASTRNDPIALETPVADSLRATGTLCLKGVAGIQYLYDPYRIKKPLKRSGPRGSGRFEPVEWEQLIREITEGGKLFAGIGEDRHIDGLRAIRSFDPVDPEAPELGPKAYQLVWNTGRGQPGRQEFIERWMKAFGSANYVTHTDLCQMNWSVTNYIFTGNYDDEFTKESIKPTSQLFGDIVNSKYMIFFGVNLGGAWKPGVNTSAPILANRHAAGECKLVLVDPYVPHGRHYADEWVAIHPGTDAALALGMIRWIFDNKRYSRAYMENPNQEAAYADGELTWTNGPYLVVTEPGDPRAGRFLRTRDIGKGGNDFVVVDAATGELAGFLQSAAGELFVERTVPIAGGSLRVKSAWQLLRDEAGKHSIDDWANICGVPASTIARLADEFTSHGKQASASCYRGVAMHSNGIYAGLAINMLNALIGNFNWKGGVTKNAGGPDWKKGLYNLETLTGAPKVKGVHISRIDGRSDVTYEESTEYKRKVAAGENPYPATRPWYPFSHAGITTEALAGADTAYPYPVKCYITYYINSIQSIPGGSRYIETLKDPAKIPLFLCVDTTISETSIYADYIIPDVMYLDGQYGFMGQQAGACSAPHTAIRTPAVEPRTDRLPDGRAIMLETFLIDLAGQLGLPGYGDDAIPGEGRQAGRTFPLRTAEDYYVRAIANIAANAKTPEASAEETAWVEKNSLVASHRSVLTDAEWRRSAYLLARGGYFEATEKAWDDRGRHAGGLELNPRIPLHIWHERLATTIQPGSGLPNFGTATYRPAEDGRGRKIEEMDADYPFRVVTFRLATRTKARTAYDYWALETHPLNYVEMNPEDAAALGIGRGDPVRISSPSGSAEGFVKLSPRCRRGVIAGTHHFGHTQQGNSPWEIKDAAGVMTGGSFVSEVLHGMYRPVAEGNQVRPDKRRGSRGFNVNNAMRRNTDLAGTPLVDNAGGATVYLDTRVKVEKV